jgi:hypothetical protein
MLVTGWQSKAQISDRYGTLADAVLSGHRSKVFFSGIDDPSTGEYVSKLAGTTQVPQRSWNADVQGHNSSVSEQPQREDLLPSHLVRQMAPQRAVLIHGTLPPVHLELVRWWREPALRRLVPTDDDGRPAPSGDILTCPLTDEPAELPRPVPDLAVIDDPAERLPGRPPPNRNGHHPAPGPRRGPARDMASSPGGDHAGPRRSPGSVAAEGVVVAPPDDSTAEAGREPNRVAGVCERCNTWLKVGAGEAIPNGRRQLIRCFPRCPSAAASPVR